MGLKTEEKGEGIFRTCVRSAVPSPHVLPLVCRLFRAFVMTKGGGGEGMSEIHGGAAADAGWRRGAAAERRRIQRNHQ